MHSSKGAWHFSHPFPIWLLSSIPPHFLLLALTHSPVNIVMKPQQVQLWVNPLPQILHIRRALWRRLAFHLPLPNQQLLFPFTLKAISEYYQLLRKCTVQARAELEIHRDLGWATEKVVIAFRAAVSRYSYVSRHYVCSTANFSGKWSPAVPAEVAQSQHWVEPRHISAGANYHVSKGWINRHIMNATPGGRFF